MSDEMTFDDDYEEDVQESEIQYEEQEIEEAEMPPVEIESEEEEITDTIEEDDNQEISSEPPRSDLKKYRKIIAKMEDPNERTYYNSAVNSVLRAVVELSTDDDESFWRQIESHSWGIIERLDDE